MATIETKDGIVMEIGDRDPMDPSVQQAVIAERTRRRPFERRNVLGEEGTNRAAQEEMANQNIVGKVAYGIGRAPQSLYSGVKQLVTGGDPQQTNQEQTAQALDKAGGAPTMAGRIGGEVAMTALPLAKAAQLTQIPRAARVASNIAGSAALEGGRAVTPEQSRGENALLGGTFGAVGASFPKALQFLTGGGAIKPTASAQQIIDRGGVPTIGQAAGPGIVRNIEEGAKSIPFFGQPIVNARNRALKEFSDQAVTMPLEQLRSFLPDINAYKRLALQSERPADVVRDVIGEQYSRALAGRELSRGVADNMISSAVSAVDDPAFVFTKDQGGNILNFTQKYILDQFHGGKISAENWKKIDSELGAQAAKLRASSDAAQRDMGYAYGQLQSTWRSSMAHELPDEVAQRLERANAGYRDLLRAERAAAYAGKDQGLITPARLNRAESVMAPKRPSGGREIPQGTMADWAKAGQDVLPNTMADSGTPYRLMTGAAITGAAGVALPKTLALSALPWVMYTKPGQRFMIGATGAHGERMRQMAEAMRKAGVPEYTGAALRGWEDQ